MKDSRTLRTLRFVFFALGESPEGDGESRGARHVARAIAAESQKSAVDPVTGLPNPRTDVIGLLHLDRVGALSPASGPDDPALVVSLMRTSGAEKLHAYLDEFLADDPVETKTVDFSPGGPDSDVRAFTEAGIPVVSVSGLFDGAESEAGQAVPAESLARVVMRLRHGIGRIVAESPTNDGMLTPGSTAIR
jgi:hypothetical protein